MLRSICSRHASAFLRPADLSRFGAVLTASPVGCRWPIGDPKTPEFKFCGKRRTKGLSYCCEHQEKAFSPE